MWTPWKNKYTPIAPGQSYDDYTQQQKSAAKSKFIKTAAIGSAAMAGGPLLSAWLGGAGAAAGAPAFSSAVPASFGAPAAIGGAGAATSGATAGTIGATAAPGIAAKTMGVLNSPAVNLGVNSLFGWLGKRSGDKAAETARQDQLAAQREALALQRQQLETEARNADLDREDARALNAAINELKKRELDAAEEERAYNREQSEFTKAQYLASEARKAPYRQISQDAMNRLASLWRLG